MATAQDALNELSADGQVKIVDYDVDRKGADFEGKPRRPLSVREAAARQLFELTLWLPTLTGDELRAREQNEPGHVETMLGHARDGASWGKDNNMQGRDIQVKCDKILRNQAKLAEKLGVEGIER